MISITEAQEGDKRFLSEPKLDTICLLAGHILETGEVIAQCAICDVSGCISCLDTHRCDDYAENKELL